MGSLDGLSDGDDMEAQLLADPVSQPEYEDSVGGGKILYRATFEELERNFLNYETVQWILISLLLILAWGVGILLLLYTPLRRYVMRQDFRSRKLYVTSNAIVYKVTRPVFLPCLGVSKMEKCILLPLITDIVVEQGCLQSTFGVHSIRIETLGQGRPLAANNIHICGLVDARQFRKVVLTAAAKCRQEGPFTMGVSSSPKFEDTVILGLPRHNSESGSQSQPWALPRVTAESSWQVSYSQFGSAPDSTFSVSGDRLLRKLDDLGHSLKRIEILIEGQ